MHLRKTRPFLLLEVIIAFTLVIMCIIPLIAPHVFIAGQQRKFIRQIELDHFINLFYAEMLEKLYRGQVDWNTITGGAKNPIEDPRLDAIFDQAGGKYKGSYWFENPYRKPPGPAARFFYLFRLHLLFESQDIGKNVSCDYDIFIVQENSENNAS